MFSVLNFQVLRYLNKMTERNDIKHSDDHGLFVSLLQTKIHQAYV